MLSQLALENLGKISLSLSVRKAVLGSGLRHFRSKLVLEYADYRIVIRTSSWDVNQDVNMLQKMRTGKKCPRAAGPRFEEIHLPVIPVLTACGAPSCAPRTRKDSRATTWPPPGSSGALSREGAAAPVLRSPRARSTSRDEMNGTQGFRRLPLANGDTQYSSTC